MNLERTLRGLYDPSLAYHNWEHAAIVRDRAMKLACRVGYEKYDLIEIASLAHDVCLTANRPRRISAEQFSSRIVAELLHGRENPERIAEICRAIEETSHKLVPTTDLGKILRAADLAGLADPDQYREDFEKLMIESDHRDIREFYLANERFLGWYLHPLVRLSDYCWNERGASDWHSKALKNMVSIRRELFDEPIAIEIGPGNSPMTLYRETEGLVIGVEPDSTLRSQALTLIDASGSPTELIVPGRGDALPIDFKPDVFMATNVALRHPEAIDVDELRRIQAERSEITETYAPADRFGGNVDSAMRWIVGRMNAGGYKLYTISPATDLPIPTASDAFRASFSK